MIYPSDAAMLSGVLANFRLLIQFLDAVVAFSCQHKTSLDDYEFE